MPIARKLRIVLLCTSSALLVTQLSACVTMTTGLGPGAAAVLPGMEKARKAYALQQKLQALAFSVRSDPAGGQFAFIATKDVKGFPISLNLDLAASPMTRAMGVAGLAIPLTGSTVAFDAPVVAQLGSMGVPEGTISEMQSTLSAAVEAVNTLGS
jgi:hypothetical protein